MQGSSENPGTSSTECGASVSKGLALNLKLQYASGSNVLTGEMTAFESAAREAGINMSLTTATYDTVLSNAVQCTPGQASCKWEMENWGIGWEYSPDNYPTGGEILAAGAGSNYGSYSSTEADTLIGATHTAADSRAALDSYQNFMAEQLPVIYQPMPNFTVSLISSKLGGVTQNPYIVLMPEDWYFKKS